MVNRKSFYGTRVRCRYSWPSDSQESKVQHKIGNMLLEGRGTLVVRKPDFYCSSLNKSWHSGDYRAFAPRCPTFLSFLPASLLYQHRYIFHFKICSPCLLTRYVLDDPSI